MVVKSTMLVLPCMIPCCIEEGLLDVVQLKIYSTSVEWIDDSKAKTTMLVLSCVIPFCIQEGLLDMHECLYVSR